MRGACQFRFCKISMSELWLIFAQKPCTVGPVSEGSGIGGNY